jgi:L-ascorbate peroxidase
MSTGRVFVRRVAELRNTISLCVRTFVHICVHIYVRTGEWPAAGGAIGSIRFSPEINHGANAGLASAVELLEPVKQACPEVSYADIFQMASARSIELAGGPKIDMKYGRLDAADPSQCSPEGNLPDAEAGENGEYGGDGGTASTKDKTPYGHLRKVFYRMGFDDEGIVALSGGKCRRALQMDVEQDSLG